jgi:hypothetical protein
MHKEEYRYEHPEAPSATEQSQDEALERFYAASRAARTRASNREPLPWNDEYDPPPF